MSFWAWGGAATWWQGISAWEAAGPGSGWWTATAGTPSWSGWGPSGWASRRRGSRPSQKCKTSSTASSPSPRPTSPSTWRTSSPRCCWGRPSSSWRGRRAPPSSTPRTTPPGGWGSRRTARCCGAPTTALWRRWCPTWPCCGGASGIRSSPWRATRWAPAPAPTWCSATSGTGRTPSFWTGSGTF